MLVIYFPKNWCFMDYWISHYSLFLIQRSLLAPKEGSQGVEDVVNHLVFDALDKLPAQETPLLSGTPEQSVQTEAAGKCHIL